MSSSGEPITPAVRRSFDKFERQKHSLLCQLTQWSMARVSFRPAPSSWSALEVLDHLVKVEQAVLLDIRSRLPDGELVSFKDRVGAYLVFAVMRFPLRVKTPASTPTALPQPGRLLRGCPPMGRGQKQSEKTARYLAAGTIPVRSVSPPDLMTMPRALTFLSAHLHHHGYQLNRFEKVTSRL